MGTKINYTKRASQILEIEEYEVNELVKRMYGHFNKNGFAKDEIVKSFFILNDIKIRKEKIRLETTAPLLGFKNKGIEQYKGNIVKLHDEGKSTHEIHKNLKLNKKDAPSLSTIKRYIKSLQEWRSNNG
ncbi:hypothetical protein [Sulfurimonas paralvinellae]|uniref:Uncharacterized protein n=1 Tax=Sulfurimonas paralvinellae TaxID=317658 RepID=A0A7M1BAB5_9BACT|nr:hypothetical protein [Sulfurimonas paralvinellae]QOP45692.1 hypothetical protein FM071_05095 [Sulfurimonas paralvinellae]